VEQRVFDLQDEVLIDLDSIEEDEPTPRKADPEPLPQRNPFLPSDFEPSSGLGLENPFTIERPYNPFSVTKDPLLWYAMAWINFLTAFGVGK
jgi:hypothetical protein